MKYFILTIFLYSFLDGYCQVYGQVGQTKSYIISQYSMCRITYNLPNYLGMNCSDLDQYFSFDKDGLCDSWEFEVLETDKNDIQKKLESDGAAVNGLLYYPFSSPCKAGQALKTSQGHLYKKNDVYIYVYDIDFCGDKKSGKSTIFASTFPLTK